jgi:RHS repeat-associated protein
VRGNRLTSSESVSSSLDLSDTSYTYDLQNTLTGLTKNGNTTIFTYYADGLRYLKSTGTSHTQVNYDFSGQVIAEEKLSGSTVIQQSSFVRGDRVLVKKDKTAAKDYYYLYNGHGDVVQIVNTSGTPVNTYSYDEWGNITSQTEGIQNSFKYAGEIYDTETGLYYLRARYYDPSIGRFLNEDTVEGQIDNPLSQNLYTYVHNNPLIYNDPTGHYAEAGTGGVGGSEWYVDLTTLTQFELLSIVDDKKQSADTRAQAMAEFMKRDFMLIEIGGVKAASGGQKNNQQCKKGRES